MQFSVTFDVYVVTLLTYHQTMEYLRGEIKATICLNSILPSKAMEEMDILVIYWSAQGKQNLWGNFFYQDHPPWLSQLKQGLINV